MGKEIYISTESDFMQFLFSAEDSVFALQESVVESRVVLPELIDKHFKQIYEIKVSICFK